MDEHYEEVIEPEDEDERSQTNLLPTNLLPVAESDKLISGDTRLKMDITDNLYRQLYLLLGVKPVGIHYDLIELKDGGIYYKGLKEKEKKRKISNINGALKSIQTIKKLLGDKRLEALGFFEKEDLPTSDQINKSTPEETIEMVNMTERNVTEIINETSFTNVGNQTNVSDKGIQTNDQFSLRELKGLDKSMQTISGSLKKALAEKNKN